VKLVDQRTVSVGTTPVTLCAANPRRVAIQIGCPLGAAGAWVALLWNLTPTAITGMPLFFGGRPMVLHQSDYG
jgi:hypothetical protein